jgi:lysine-ketoglutarate reductase/saccharopine dehydrogenase-like protein (TIGR00300 family)
MYLDNTRTTKGEISMSFHLDQFSPPDFSREPFLSAPNVHLANVMKDGVAPQNFHAMSIYPEYFKIQGQWILASESRMDCVPVLKEDCSIKVVEFRNLKIGDYVVLGRTEDASEGIYVYAEGFASKDGNTDLFAFRSGRSRETAYSKDYNNLYDLLRYEKDHGYIVWVLGPAVVFDYDSRAALAALIENGYVHSILAGNALATHDLEASILGTALGQNTYTQESQLNGHYNHLDVINRARDAGSLEALINSEKIQEGIVYTAIKKRVPLILAGSIRDDGPLPPVLANVYEAQDEMRKHTRKATTLICLATQLHTIAAGNMTPAYTECEGIIRPVFIYSIDVAEFAVNKLRDRGSLEVTTIVTNVQDFLVNVSNNLRFDSNNSSVMKASAK